MRSKDYRSEAREILKGNWVKFVLFTLLLGALNSSNTFMPNDSSLGLNVTVSIVGILVVLPITFLFTASFLAPSRGVDISFNVCKEMFEKLTYVRLLIGSLLVMVYTALWTLFFIIPGIIKTYSYALTPYLLYDDPSLSGNAAITKSRHLMDGNKWSLFVLDLTFIGWYILTIFTLFIGTLWVIPYHQAARARFYERIISEQTTTVE